MRKLITAVLILIAANVFSQQTNNQGLTIAAQQSVDGKQYRTLNGRHVPYTDTAQFMATIPTTRRHIGQIAYIYNGANIEVWQFVGGIASLNFIKILPTANSSTFANGLIRTGIISITDNTLNIAPVVEWRIDNINYSKTINTSFTIPNASPNNQRRDIIYADAFGVLTKIQGVEDTAQVVAPPIPANTVEVTTVDIIGSSLSATPSVSSNDWTLRGNVVTDDSAVLGPTNNRSLNLITNNLKRFTIDSTGNYLFNTTGSLNGRKMTFGPNTGQYYWGVRQQPSNTTVSEMFLSGYGEYYPNWTFKMWSGYDNAIMSGIYTGNTYFGYGNTVGSGYKMNLKPSGF